MPKKDKGWECTVIMKDGTIVTLHILDLEDIVLELRKAGLPVEQVARILSNKL